MDRFLFHVILILSLGSSATASEGSRLTAMAYCKAKIQAVVGKLDAANLLITNIALFDDGRVKVNLTNPQDSTCRAAVYATLVNADGTVSAISPQRASCVE